MNELIDLTDKLAKKRGPLTQHIFREVPHTNGQLDYSYIFFLVFTGLLILTEPLFIFTICSSF
jgi:hypothetical protein